MVDAGPELDAGYPIDAGTDAGFPIDAGTDGGTSTDGGTDGGGTPASTLIRLMAANITSGNLQSYDPGHGIRIFQGTQPDIVMIQEFKYGDNSPTAIRQFVDTTFGPGFSYFRETGVGIPNGVISRWPIVASGEWDDTQVGDRDFAWARIDVPGPKDLWVVSVHLLTSGSTVRNTEAINLVNLIQANIPEGDYLAIGGDFNSDGRGEALFSTFSQVVTTASPYPADRNGNTNTNAGRAKPYDHVLVDADLRQYQVATVIGGSTFSAGLVADTRVYSPISEIAPALSDDSGAINMQHMAIIKDFLIPGGTATAAVSVASPNGGESWAAGSVHNITWTSSGVANVKLEYTLDGSSWMTITPSTTASAGSYAWTVPNSPTTTARVQVSDASNSALSDTSNAPFSIVIPSITVTSPNGGEFLEGGSTYNITWTASNVASVRLEYTLDGFSWTTITASTAALPGTYAWTVPNSGTNSAMVRVSDTSNLSLYDTSDTAFTIFPVSITVSSPNGGESWVGNSAHDITWTATNVANVKLEYTLNGSSWTTITASTAASAGSYAWTVPNSPTSTARVRVSQAGNPAISDTSNAAFTITSSGGGGTGTVFLNEVLVNEPGSDVNGEFVELVNSGTTAVDISGWAIWDATAVRHTFVGGTVLGAGQAVVVFGGSSAIPGNLPNAVAASTGSLNLGNSTETVTVKNVAGTTVDTATFGSALTGTDGVSANRSPDGSSSGVFVLHTTLRSGSSSSPGVRVDGSPF